MRRKLSKNAMLLIGIVSLCLIITVVILTQRTNSNTDDIKETYAIEEVITENQILKIQLLDFVSTKNMQEKPTSQNVVVAAKENIAGVEITNKQTFSKAIHLQAPAEDATPFVHENKMPSHNAYILVLVGDIVKYVDNSGNEKFVIENARIEYYIQTVLLEESYNSLYISSIDGSKEKMVKVDDYKQAFNSVDTYYEMLQW
ncbi:MAG: hypothetical protein ACK5LC_17590 [Coprobacillaceae bacterium]